MENIRQAVERARARGGEPASERARAPSGLPRRRFELGINSACGIDQEIELNGVHLQSKRIITHLSGDPRSRSFDMLRTQVLQSMDLKGWKILAITSPTAACGKTLTALNLTL